MIYCALCNAKCPGPGPKGGAAGYAVLLGIGEVCYPCADKQQQQEVAESKPGDSFWAYVSGDKQRITTWTGGNLMRITHRREDYSTFGRKTYHFWARDLQNHRWYGKNAGFFGGGSCCIRMRMLKRKLT